MKRSTKKGFTIVELVIVIAIIAILAAVLIPTFASLIQKANESNDIQAAKNMNTFLAAANVTGDVKSILDVYDVFEDSGFAVENYTPLYKNRYYYYDKEYNQILYVDGDNDTVLYPTEHKGEKYSTLKHNWMSLSMSAPTGTRPEGNNFTEPTPANNTMTATVKNAAEYAYVIDAYNKADASVSLDLTIDGEIDMKGARCVIQKKQITGAIKIVGKDANNKAVIKNITSNLCDYSNDNASGTEAAYWTSALIAGDVYNNVTIQNIKFENLNVKNVYAGNVSFLVGRMLNTDTEKYTLTVNNVEIKDSTLVGHRWVGAVGGQICCGEATITGLKLINTSVQTVGGRAAMILSAGSKCDVNITNFVNENSTFGIYDSKKSEQKFSDTKPTDDNNFDAHDVIEGGKYITSIKNPDTKECRTYCYKDGTLVFVYCGGADGKAAVYTAENFTNGGLSISKSGS